MKLKDIKEADSYMLVINKDGRLTTYGNGTLTERMGIIEYARRGLTVEAINKINNSIIKKQPNK